MNYVNLKTISTAQKMVLACFHLQHNNLSYGLQNTFQLLNIDYFLQPKTKKFIDKKNAVTFNLVHRSQKDPLAADEKAPQRVLVPIGLKTEKNAESSSSSKSMVNAIQTKLRMLCYFNKLTVLLGTRKSERRIG